MHNGITKAILYCILLHFYGLCILALLFKKYFYGISFKLNYILKESLP